VARDVEFMGDGVAGFGQAAAQGLANLMLQFGDFGLEFLDLAVQRRCRFARRLHCFFGVSGCERFDPSR